MVIHIESSFLTDSALDSLASYLVNSKGDILNLN